MSDSYCSLVETKNNQVQTENQLHKNAAIQHQSIVSCAQKDSNKKIKICSATEKSSKKNKTTVTKLQSNFFEDENKRTFKNIETEHIRRISRNLIENDDFSVQTCVDYCAVEHKINQSSHKVNKSKKTCNRKKRVKHCRRPSSDKNLPIWASSYQLQNTFQCESLEKINKKSFNNLQSNYSSNLISFDKCCTTSSSKFIFRHVTKSQQFDKCTGDQKIDGTLQDSLKGNSTTSINSQITVSDNDMSEDSLICGTNKKICSVTDSKLHLKADKLTQGCNVTQCEICLPKHETPFDLEKYCTLPTTVTPKASSTKVDEINAKSKISEAGMYVVKEKMEVAKIEAEKLSETEEDENEYVISKINQCKETGKYEDELQIRSDVFSSDDTCSSKTVDDFNYTHTKNKCSLPHITTHSNTKLSLISHSTNLEKDDINEMEDKTEETLTASILSEKNLKESEGTITSFEIQNNDIKSNYKEESFMNVLTETTDENNWYDDLCNNHNIEGLTQNKQKTKEPDIFYFPSITIYNKKYVDSIGNWIKDYKSENSLDDKICLSPSISIENETRTNTSNLNISNTYINKKNNCDKTDSFTESTEQDSETLSKTDSGKFRKLLNFDFEQLKNEKSNCTNDSYSSLKLSDKNKETKKLRESRIPILVPNNKNKLKLQEIENINMLESNICTLHSQIKYLKNLPSIKCKNGLKKSQSDMDTLISLCSLDDDSRTIATHKKGLKRDKPKHPFVSKTYCTIKDFVNIEDTPQSTTKKSNESDKCSSQSAQCNSSLMIPLPTNESLNTSICSSVQSSSHKDRLQTFMSSFHNKKGAFKSFMMSLKKKEHSGVKSQTSNNHNSKHQKQLNKNINCHRDDNLHQRNDEELSTGCKILDANKSLNASSYQTIFSKNTELTEVSSDIKVLYPASEMEDTRDSETFTVCAPNLSLHNRPRSMESFFKPHRDIWKSKSDADSNQFSEHYCETTKKTYLSNSSMNDNKHQECYHYCKCGQLLKIEIVKNSKCSV